MSLNGGVSESAQSAGFYDLHGQVLWSLESHVPSAQDWGVLGDQYIPYISGLLAFLLLQDDAF